MDVPRSNDDDDNTSLSSGVIAALAILAILLFLMIITLIIIVIKCVIKRENVDKPVNKSDFCAESHRDEARVSGGSYMTPSSIYLELQPGNNGYDNLQGVQAT